MIELNPAVSPTSSAARAEPVAVTERRKHGKGWHRKAGDLHVLKLRGSFREMGEQHGALLREEVRRGPVPYFRTYFEKMIGRSQLGALGPLVWPLLQKSVGTRVARGMQPFALETLRGLAEGSGLSYEELLDGCTMPDAVLWLASKIIQLKVPGPAVAHRLSLGLGCTSAVAWGDATTDGKLYHARNFDYHGVSCWPDLQAVVFHEPDQGQRYVSIAAAGVLLGGITAMNESGLSLTVHQHMFTDRTRLGGTPIGVTGDRVMREAKSLADAEAILASDRPNGCWTYVITDGREKRVLAWEENPDRKAPLRVPTEAGTFGYANVYLDPELGETEANLYGSYWRHNEARHRRSNALLRARAGKLDAHGMASILADTGDTTCRVSEAIAMVMTTASVVFRPEDGVVWVGTGQTPTSHNAFVPFSLRDEDVAGDLPVLRVGAPVESTARRAFEHYRRAYVAYLDDGDVARARTEMDAARALEPQQAIYQYLAGLCALQLADADGAAERLGRAVELGHPHEARRAAFALWHGRALDLLGRRAEAKRQYRQALVARGDAGVHAAAKKGLGKAFARGGVRKFNVDFSLGDVVQP